MRKSRHTTISKLPPSRELASRIEEAKTSAALLTQLVQATPAIELLRSDLICEFVDRCANASAFVQAYMIAQDPAPDNETLLALIEADKYLSLAKSKYRRAIETMTKTNALPSLKTLSLAEVSEHSRKKDLYLLIHDKVYDASSFVDDHPGGEEALLNVAGKDATVPFEDIGHSGEARYILETFQIGTLKKPAPKSPEVLAPVSKDSAQLNYEIQKSDFLEQNKIGFGKVHECKEELYRRRLDAALQRVKVLESEIQDMKNKVQSHDEAVSATKGSSIHTREKLQNQEHLFGPQVPDSEIRTRFVDLLQRIKQWTRHFRGGNDKHRASPDPDIREMFKFVVPGIVDKQLERILDSRSKTRYFIRGWVSLVFVRAIHGFRKEESGTLLMPISVDRTEAESVANLVKFLLQKDIKPSQLHTWRALTVYLISGGESWTARADEAIEFISHMIRNVLEAFCEMTGREQVWAELEAILYKLLGFSRLLSLQRANWFLGFPSRAAEDNNSTKLEPSSDMVRFDPETMKSVEDDEERRR